MEIKNFKNRLKTYGNRVLEGIKNRSFRVNLLGMIIKTIIFTVLIHEYGKIGDGGLSAIPPLIQWIGILASLLAIGFLFKGKSQKHVFWIINILFTILLIGDTWYFRSNGRFLSFYMLGMTDNLANLEEALFGMIRMVDFTFLIDIVIIGFMNFKSKIFNIEFKKNRAATCGIILVCFSYISISSFFIPLGEEGEKTVFGWNGTSYDDILNYTPVGYHLVDLKGFYDEAKPLVLSDEEISLNNKLISSLKGSSGSNKYEGMLKDKNLIVIQWESLETFLVNQKINGQEITPNLNKLLGKSLYFNNYYEQTDGGTSSDGEFITNTSVLPVNNGAVFYRFPENTYKNSLPNIFETLGYNTIASHPDNAKYWNWYENLENMGYNKLYDEGDYTINERINMGMADEDYLKQFSEKLASEKEKFMAYTITLTSHTPFTMPESHKKLNLPDNIKNTKLGDYFQAINYTDRCIGEFINSLEKSGKLKDTVIAIYGDHEGVHRYFSDEVEDMKNLEPWMKENNKKVPLVIYNEDISGEVIEVNGGQVDFLPTIAYLFGAKEELYSSNLTIGRNLLNTSLDYVLLSTGEVVGRELSKEQEENIRELRNISDKMIRGNYFSK
ncbi:MAG: LTA synthase family protein [Clostridium sp.]